ncbi:MAG TPA: hypothetical protein VK826_09395 [Bacteroidia bacterium]|nr:hypothetical protein [Bacteroidia bacterium]
MAASLNFSQVLLYTFDKLNPQEITLGSGKALKIESIGISGSNGTVFLQNNAEENLAILFSTIDRNDYGASFPFWLPPGFDGFLFNDSNHTCAVSATEYDFVP